MDGGDEGAGGVAGIVLGKGEEETDEDDDKALEMIESWLML